MAENINNPNLSGLHEFGPITPDDRPQGYGFTQGLSRFFRRTIRGI